MSQEIDADRALTSEGDDEYGFAAMAASLAPRIVSSAKGEGLVIGLEGKWGAGKTSFLNLLKSELTKSKADKVHTITIAPWLDGDSSSLVASLLSPMMEILAQQQAELDAQSADGNAELMAELSELATSLKDYSIRTARSVAPLAKMAGHLLPGAAIAGDVLDTGAQYFEDLGKRTPTQLKEKISQSVAELDIAFIVILDDLDRLEPSQAVEVVRLVRSVADFPNVTYLMCYDREVLAHALQVGLSVSDGDQFLQKIVQLSFSLPLPEPFDLRSRFLVSAKQIFTDVTGEEPEGDMLADLRSAVDREGSRLSTPREVKLALNSIRFTFPSIHTDTYFPDLCRLHLIKTTFFPLYKWLEGYLASRSVVITGNATVSEDSKADMGSQLKELLPSDTAGSVNSIWSLGGFIPGVIRRDQDEDCVFSSVSHRQAGDAILQKRVGSPLHHRFYFALTGPKNVLPDSDYYELVQLASDDVNELVVRLLQYASSKRSENSTWLEHIFDRLDTAAIEALSKQQASGFALAMGDVMDAQMQADGERRAFAITVERQAVRVLEELLAQVRRADSDLFEETATNIATAGVSLNWLVGHFFREQARDHGRAGDRPAHESQRLFSDELLDQLIEILGARTADPAVQAEILSLPSVSAYLFGWNDVINREAPRAWVAQATETDEGFLNVLESLRSWAMSDTVYYPLHRSTVDVFFDFDRAQERLENLVNTEHGQKATELIRAMEQARS